MLQKIITKEVHEKLPAHFKTEYKEVPGENGAASSFMLDIEGDEDVGALKRAKDHEKQARLDAEKKVGEAQAKIDKIEADAEKARLKALRDGGDIEALEKSWKAKADKAERDAKAESQALRDKVSNTMLKGKALEIATQISTIPDVILPLIKDRLRVEEVDGEFITSVLDVKGQPSAMTIEELQKEFVDNPKFSSIIIGSKASGGGAGGSGGGGGAPSTSAIPFGKLDLKGSPAEVAGMLKGRLRTPPGS